MGTPLSKLPSRAERRYGGRGPGIGSSVGLTAAALCWAFFSFACVPSAAAFSNDGGVLLLHVESVDDPSKVQVCDLQTLRESDKVATRIPADGREHVVGVYASFPPDSLGLVAGVTFGIRYSPNVTIRSHGACNRDGLVVPESSFPAEGSGLAVVVNPPTIGNLFPVYWFVVSAEGPGFFEVTPMPHAEHAGSFGTAEVPPVLTPIADYGKVGFDLAGHVPVAGEIPARGACCLAVCKPLTEEECRFFGGTYLGDEGDCTTRPCGEDALLGACCLGSGCEVYTWLECVKLGGAFVGEQTECDPDACAEMER